MPCKALMPENGALLPAVALLLESSGWDQVVPKLFGRQAKTVVHVIRLLSLTHTYGNCHVVADHVM